MLATLMPNFSGQRARNAVNRFVIGNAAVKEKNADFFAVRSRRGY